MKTVFKTGPGFFAAYTKEGDPSIANGKMQIYLASIEVVELDSTPLDNDTHFTLLVAMAEGRPDIAKAILMLGSAIEQNREILQDIAKGKK